MSEQEQTGETRTAHDGSALRVMAMTLARDRLARQLGHQYGGDRDLYGALGYERDLEFRDYWNKYQRQDVARRIVVEPVNATWRQAPVVVEPRQGREMDEPTEFERAFRRLARRQRLFHYLARTDRLAGVGQYAILLLGFDDDQPLNEPVRNPNTLLYVSPYTQEHAEVHRWVTEPGDPRFGLPLSYRVKLGGSDESQPNMPVYPRIVHWTRVLHVPSDGLEESDVFGTPRLKPVFNRLQDLEKVVGGSGEMFWRGAFPGQVYKAEKDANFDADSLEQEIEDYVHKLKRHLKVQGVDVEQLQPNIADPNNHVAVIIDLVSAATGIPKRKLLGSERGEMASGQDETNWNGVITERRENHSEPLLRTLIERLVGLGILPEPNGGDYEVRWAPTADISPEARAQVARDLSQAIAAYVNALGAPQVVPLDVFLGEVLNLDERTVKDIRDRVSEAEATDRLETPDDEGSESQRGSRGGAAADQSREADVARS